jgi:NTP-dependent ternary system trypsin peptidase co-occuring protein
MNSTLPSRQLRAIANRENPISLRPAFALLEQRSALVERVGWAQDHPGVANLKMADDLLRCRRDRGSTLMDLKSPVVRGLLYAATLAAAAFAGSLYSARVARRDLGLADKSQPLEIKDLIGRVREELAAAETDMLKRHDLALFRLKDFEMEINYVIRTGSVVKTEVVGVGTDLNVDRERVQKLTLRWAVCPERIHGTVPASKSDSVPAELAAGPKQPIVIGPVPASPVPSISSTGVSNHEDCN